MMCGGLILSCCPRNPHGHERALKEEEEYIGRCRGTRGPPPPEAQKFMKKSNASKNTVYQSISIDGTL